jgi:hypothetical protein
MLGAHIAETMTTYPMLDRAMSELKLGQSGLIDKETAKKIDGGTETCDLTATAETKDAHFCCFDRSHLIDRKGRELNSSQVAFGRQRHLRFEGIEVAGGQVPLIEIRFSDTTRGGRGEGRVQFRNVSVK